MRATTIARSVAAALLLLAAASSCSADKILEVDVPDIIAPGAVTTPAGAEALRVGAFRQLNVATGGVETVEASSAFFDSMWLLSGLLADEFRSGDTFIERDETDRRAISESNALVEGGYRALQRARVDAALAELALAKYDPDAPVWKRAQMLFTQGYVETLLAEYFCSGVPIGDVDLSGPTRSSPSLTTEQALERAVAHFDAALALLADDDAAESDVARNAAAVGKGRALLGLARYADAAAAVADVPTEFAFGLETSATPINNAVWEFNLNERRYTVGDADGGNGLDFFSANDPRLPRCEGGDDVCTAAGAPDASVFDNSVAGVLPFYVQLVYPAKDAPFTLVNGVEARLIEAEAQLQAGGAGFLGTLNDLRATVGLGALADPGSAAARADLLFRERAFWLFATGHRLGDLRRLVRQYGRSADSVFPVGAFIKGGEYGDDVNFPISQAERNNPQFQGCLNRDA